MFMVNHMAQFSADFLLLEVLIANLIVHYSHFLSLFLFPFPLKGAITLKPPVIFHITQE